MASERTDKVMALFAALGIRRTEITVDMMEAVATFADEGNHND